MRNWDVICLFCTARKDKVFWWSQWLCPSRRLGEIIVLFDAFFAVFVCCGQDYVGYPFPPELDQRSWFFDTMKGGEIILSLPAVGETLVMTKAKTDFLS